MFGQLEKLKNKLQFAESIALIIKSITSCNSANAEISYVAPAAKDRLAAKNT
jgi:hypothetical protein